MRVIRELDRRIERKKQDIFGLEKQLAEARAYLAALEDTRKLLPKDIPTQQDIVLRAGTDVAKVQTELKKSGKALHIDELLKRIGKTPDKRSKVSLSGSLATYARSGRIFTRPAPNTFGLLEFETSANNADEPPEEFGTEEVKDD